MIVNLLQVNKPSPLLNQLPKSLVRLCVPLDLIGGAVTGVDQDGEKSFHDVIPAYDAKLLIILELGYILRIYVSLR